MDQRATTDLELVSYGLSGAYRVSESFDVGLGVIYHEPSLDAQATTFIPVDGLS